MDTKILHAIEQHEAAPIQIQITAKSPKMVVLTAVGVPLVDHILVEIDALRPLIEALTEVADYYAPEPRRGGDPNPNQLSLF